ncbi:MAG: aspartate carbamoyltransferase [Muribaculaceae bacterium]|nr:aspartate carbamoyltransferase [Muribaculaceae bacterium]
MKHLIDPTDLSREETEEIIDLALDIIDNPQKYAVACKGKKLSTLFYERSSRTLLSFTASLMELGGNVLGFSDARNSSVSKGETCADTTKVINCFADIIAMRHFEEGAAHVSAMNSNIPVINAGDGSHAHPTQTLTDLLTIKREIGRFDNLTIGFCGDLKFGRTVHSLIKALSRYEGVKVVLIAPEQLQLPDYMKKEVCEANGIPFKEVTTLEEVMPELDVLYMTRVQKERFFDEDEFDRVKDCFILDSEKLKTAKPTMRILHPLPRVNEITVDVDSDPRAAYFRQVENGKNVRKALILKLLEWKNNPSKNTVLIPEDAVRGEFTCRNKRCISNMEVGVDSLFRRALNESEDGKAEYRCVYCESKPVR